MPSERRIDDSHQPPENIRFTDDIEHNRAQIDLLLAGLNTLEPGRTFSVSHEIKNGIVNIRISLAPYLDPTGPNFDLQELGFLKGDDIPLAYIYEIVRGELETLGE